MQDGVKDENGMMKRNLNVKSDTKFNLLARRKEEND